MIRKAWSNFFILVVFIVSTQSYFSQSIVVNELSQGTTGAQEYVEFIVTGPDLTLCTDTPPCLDLRGYIFDDNNGYLNGGAQSGVGIAAGACRFANISFWSCIPAGTKILVYNNNDVNSAVPPDDISMSDGNCSLVIPANSTLFEHHNTAPSTSNSNYSTTGWVSGGDWGTVSLANSQDGFQLYAPTNLTTPIFSLGWGSSTTLGDIYMGSSSTSGDVMYATDCNFYSQSSWTLGSASTDQTPADFNSTVQADCIGLMNHSCGIPPALMISTTPETCAGACDGAASVSVTGGTSPYQFSWSPTPASGQGTNSVSGLCNGTYYLTFTDDNGQGCVANDSAVITAGASCCSITTFTASINACTPSGGFFEVTGTVDYSGAPVTGDLVIEVVDGGSTYSTTIPAPFGGNDTWSIQNIPATGNAITITAQFSQDNLCVQTINETAPSPLSMTNTVVNVQCNGACDGSISVTATGGVAPYQYSFDGGNTFQTGNSIGSLCPGTYNLALSDNNGCLTSITESITEPNPLSINLTTSNASCFGVCDGTISSQVNGGTTPYTYTWSANATTGNNSSASNLCADSYTLSIVDQNGCQLDTTSTLISPPQVTIDAIATTDVLCNGDCNGVATVSSTNGFEYSIDGLSFLSNTTFTNLCSGNYTAYVRDTAGCEITSTFVINSPQVLTLDPFADDSICNGGTSILTASVTGGTGTYTYNWSQGLGNTSSVSVSPTSQQSYCLDVTDQNGCVSNQECATVSLYAPLSVTAYSDTALCEGETYDISVQVSGGYPGSYVINWNQGVGAGATHTISPSLTNDYIVTVTDACAYTAKDTITVIVNPLPQVSFDADQITGCVPMEINFNSAIFQTGSSCEWDFGDGNTGMACGSISNTYMQAGCYDVRLTVTSSEGCSSYALYDNYICVNDYPIADFTYSPEVISIIDTDVDFINTSIGAVSYIWSFDTLTANEQAFIENPSYSFPEIGGDYVVCLIAVSPQGCSSDTCKNIIVNELSAIYVPNAFSPNNDGVNDLFTPIVSEISEEDYSFQIFNRWGELIYLNKTPGQGWDGYHAGTTCESDVYIWKLTAKDKITGEIVYFTGHVSLLR